jgi:putative ABC transport system permease protein
MTLAAFRRRRVQAIAIATVLAFAAGAATIALDVLIESQAPFDRAFAAANGAHLVVEYDTSVPADQLATTTHAALVTDAAGPWLTGAAGFLANPADVGSGGHADYVGVRISARSDPNTSVDRMTIDAGRWWAAPGEIVLSQSWAQRYGVGVGDTLEVMQAQSGAKSVAKPGANTGPDAATTGSSPQTRTLTIVGIATSVSTPDTSGWMSQEDLTFLSSLAADDEELLYRVDPSATAGDLAQAQSAITATLPPSALDRSTSYLTLRDTSDRLAAVFVPILLAFAIFALGAAAFIIANIVSGIVLAGYREIGLMKAIGYTPRQVTTKFVAEITLPALVGAALGVALGSLAGQQIIDQTAVAFGVPPSPADALELGAFVILIVMGVASVAALIPALRAGRLSVTAVTGLGTTPPARSVGRFGRLVARERLPFALQLGLSTSTTRPIRSLMTAGALVVGVAAIVFAIGLNASLRQVATDLQRDQASPIRVELQDPSYPAASVTSAIAQNGGTQRFVSLAAEPVLTPQLGSIPLVAYQGESSWIGYELIRGRWFSAPGEVVAPTNFFTESGLSIGDHVTLALDGQTESVTLVGEIFDNARENRDNLVLRTDWSTLASLDSSIMPTGWEIQLTPSADPQDYAGALDDATGHSASFEVVSDSAGDATFLLIEGVITALGVVLVLISVAGVFNTVLLETRQRTRETAVLKAIGMTPRQVVAVVMARLVPVGVIAGLIGVPVGLVAHNLVLHWMADSAIKSDLPQSVVDVLPWAVLVGLAMTGLLIAALGAVVPAGRAARAQIAPVLAAE